ncbi:hypothetical protein Vi05172_g3782 [Venturia inaequalis]|nr:hypothetical protein Vi05172_g3782 [Venturia inaequalis]
MHLAMILTLITCTIAIPVPLNKGNRVYGKAEDSKSYNPDGSINWIPGGEGWDGALRVYEPAFGKPGVHR